MNRPIWKWRFTERGMRKAGKEEVAVSKTQEGVGEVCVGGSRPTGAR